MKGSCAVFFQRVDDDARLQGGVRMIDHIKPAKNSTITYLLDHLRQCSSLECYSSIPFHTQWPFHGALKLCFARIRIWQILYKIFCGLLVAFLGDDNIFLVVICSSRGIDPSNLLNPRWFRRCFMSTNSPPRSL